MTTQGTFTVTIDAPPEKVWPWVADLTKHPEYSPKPYQVELVAGEAGKVGTRYKSVGAIPNDKHHGNEVEVVESVPDERFVLRADDDLGPFMNTYVLRPSGSGTEVSYTLVFPPLKGAAAMMVPILFPLVGKKDIRKRLQLLKAKVESTT
jgi:uncharacterized protein YndB with AHSA1/START domain